MPVGPMELIIVLLIVLLIFGAGKLPQVGSALGKSIRELRDAAREDGSGDKPGEPTGKDGE